MNFVRFLLRILPRIGLAIVAVIFILGQRGPFSEQMTLGPIHVGMETEFHKVAIAWYPSASLSPVSYFIEGARSRSPVISVPGIQIWGDISYAVVEVRHALTCLLFLVATLLTSSRPGQPVRPNSDGHQHAETKVPRTSWHQILFDLMLLGLFLGGIFLVLALVRA